jgi:acetoin utilization deacetylase AcuC-like enzyme
MLCVYYNKSFCTDKEHIENHKRVSKPIQYLIKQLKNKVKIYSSTDVYNNIKLSNSMTNEEVEELAIEYLKNSCNKEYMNKIKKMCSELRTGEIIDGDTCFSSLTYGELIDVALIIYNACNQLMNNMTKYVYCLTRPPSHHSYLNYYSGFCVVNQTYQAAKYLFQKFNKKVFILDYDVHHGDGTQKLINNNKDDEIYFCSIHCYEKGFYPGTGTTDENSDKILNIPLKRAQTDDTYIEKFDSLISPFIKSTKPDIIIISNGLDAHHSDPMSIMKLTHKFYEYVTIYLKSLDIPLLYILEGGYNPSVISMVSEKIINLLK